MYLVCLCLLKEGKLILGKDFHITNNDILNQRRAMAIGNLSVIILLADEIA